MDERGRGDDGPDVEIIPGRHPLLPEGNYIARYLGHRGNTLRGWQKVEIEFSLIDGEYAGTIVVAYRNVIDIGERGKVGLGSNFKLAKELHALAQHQGKEKISMAVLRDVHLTVTITTSRSGGEQYSVVSRISPFTDEISPPKNAPAKRISRAAERMRLYRLRKKYRESGECPFCGNDYAEGISDYWCPVCGFVRNALRAERNESVTHRPNSVTRYATSKRNAAGVTHPETRATAGLAGVTVEAGVGPGIQHQHDRARIAGGIPDPAETPGPAPGGARSPDPEPEAESETIYQEGWL